MSWTGEMVERLRELVTNGARPTQIAHELGVSRNAVIGQCRRSKIPLRPADKFWTSERKRKLEKMVIGGYTDVEIAVELKTTKRAVQDQRGRQQMQRRAMRHRRHAPKQWTPRKPTPALPTGIFKTKTLLELDPEDCRWPFGDPREKNFCFCAAPRLFDGPYCATHVLLAFNYRP
jgi:GcrA cell cycle regulator